MRDGQPLNAAFERFVVRVSPMLVRAGFLLTGDHSQAEDLTQLALLRTWRRWDSIGQSPEAYAYAVLVNLARDRGRSLRRRVPEVRWGDDVDVGTRDATAQVLERDTLTRAVRRLPRRQREVVVLRFFLDLSVAQTAKVLEASEGAVKAYTARALTRLRDLIDSEEPSPGPRREVRDVG